MQDADYSEKAIRRTIAQDILADLYKLAVEASIDCENRRGTRKAQDLPTSACGHIRREAIDTGLLKMKDSEGVDGVLKGDSFGYCVSLIVENYRIISAHVDSPQSIPRPSSRRDQHRCEPTQRRLFEEDANESIDETVESNYIPIYFVHGGDSPENAFAKLGILNTDDQWEFLLDLSVFAGGHKKSENTTSTANTVSPASGATGPSSNSVSKKAFGLKKDQAASADAQAINE